MIYNVSLGRTLYFSTWDLCFYIYMYKLIGYIWCNILSIALNLNHLQSSILYLRNYNHTFLTWSCLCSLVGIVVIMQIKDMTTMVIEQVLKWPIDHRFDMILVQDVVTVINLIFPPFVWLRWILLRNKRRRKKTEVGERDRGGKDGLPIFCWI